MAFVQQPETLLFIKYGRIFAFGLAVVAAHTDIGIIRQLRQHVVQLPIEHFLAAENIETVEFDQPADPEAAAFPSVTTPGVALIGIADVVGSYGQLLCGGTERHRNKQNEGQYSFHKGDF